MHHRHLDLPLLHPSVAAVDSILERGGASDVRGLFSAVTADPWGDLAVASTTAARLSSVYGYPTLLVRLIETARARPSLDQIPPD